MKQLLLFLLAFSVAGVASAQTNVSGTISVDSTWSLAGSPYVVTANVTVSNGATLRIDSGVVVRFSSGTSLYSTYGSLRARYSIFTSRKDTSGGAPARGDWGTIQCGEYNSLDTLQLDTCQITWGGSVANGNVYVRNGLALLNGTTINNSSTDGMYLYSGSARITGGGISGTSQQGIYVTGGSSLLLSSTNISSVTNSGVYFEVGTSITVTNSTINSCDWPLWMDGQATLVFNGVNTLVPNHHAGVNINFSTCNSMTLDTSAIPYYFTYGMTVNAGQTLTVSTGDILKFQGNSLTINGALNAAAAPGDWIYFTSYRNDNLPASNGDTNGDATTTQPHASDWYGVVFTDQSADSVCVMHRCKVSFAGAGNTGGVTMNNASPTIDSCDLSNNYYGAMLQNVSNPIFTNNTIGTSTLVPIAMSFTANPIFSNNMFSAADNGYDAIGLLGGTLTADGVLPIRSVTSIPNVTYLMLDAVTVPPGRTLTIDKGIVIKAYSYYQRFIIQGKLVANASADSMIVFTSSKDDNFGNPNDTNKDGTGSVTARGDWSGIIFESGSDSTSVINYCRVKYGSLSGSYYYYYNGTYYSGGEVTTINSSPTISNSEVSNAVYGVYSFLSSYPKIWNNQFINTQYTPIAISVSSDPGFIGNTFTNVGYVALGIIGENVGANGEIKQRTVAGLSNISYVLLADLTINSGTTVVVDPGVVIKSGGPGIYVNGAFQAGTLSGGQVVFTSLKDDNYGNPGDTNGDGAITPPARGDWSTIRFQATSVDSLCFMDSCVVKFAGSSSYGGVTFADAGGSVTNTIVSDSYNYGVRCDGASAPIVTGATMANCRLDPIAMSLKANPTFSSITFSGNGTSGIRILEGTLSSNAELVRRDVAGITNIAYIVDNLTISSGAVLQIDPGVVIKLTNYYNGITVQGALVARGTPAQKIVFTSLSDDSNGGDTNNNGNNSVPGRGNWNAIDFVASSADTLNMLRNCQLRFAGGNNYSYEYGIVRVYNAKVVIDSCTIEQSATSAIGCFGSASPTIVRDSMNNVQYTPVTMSMFSNPTFANNSALNVGYQALGVKPETYSVDDTVPIRDFSGYVNITYELWGTMTVNSGTKITIPAGIVFKDGSWTVNGALAILGTPTSPVVFTDHRDDAYGHPGDTNGDGSFTSPTIGGGSRVYYEDGSIDSLSIVRGAIIRFADGGIDLNQASPKIINDTFDRTNWGVYLRGVSAPPIDSCTFHNLVYAPIRMSLVSFPSSKSGDVISGTTYRALGVLDGESLVQDVTLTKQTFAGDNNIPYLFGTYTVETGAVLTLSPGIILKFFPGTGMTIKKGLVAEGGAHPDSTIVFTDVRDDFYGGDTDADSTASTPTGYGPNYWYPGWNGISFADASLDPLCRLRNCVIRYAGLSSSSAAITTTNASPTISYCSITGNQNGIIANGASNPVVHYSDIYGNAQYGVNNVNKSFNIDARWNWWGSNTGPTHPGNPGGAGQAVTDSVNYGGFLGSGALNPLAGDVSLNGAIQAYDASLILKWLVDSVANPLNDIQERVADVSGVSGITAYDASLILQYVVGKISIFPIEFNRTNPPVPFLPKKASVGLLALGAATVQHGDEVSITLSAKQLTDVYSGDIALGFNAQWLTPVSVSSSGLVGKATTAQSLKPGVVRITFASPEPLAADGDLFTITFRAVDDLHGTIKAPVSFSNLLVNETDMKSASSEGFVTIVGKPTSYTLDQNYPNPFNPTTTIDYQIPEDGQHVQIDIYNVAGQLVRKLVDGVQNAGTYRITWDGSSDLGFRVGSGVYFYRMSSGKFVSVKKMLLVK